MNYYKVLSATMVMLCLIAFSAEAIAYSGGNGDPNNPFQISTVEDWSKFSNDASNWAKCFILLNDIDFAGENLNPIGKSGEAFTGSFDGNGYCLYQAVLHYPGMHQAGLFRSISSSSQIRNLHIMNISVTGGDLTGGLCGSNFGTIFQSSVIGIVCGNDDVGGLVGINSGEISSCYAAGTVCGEGENREIGGLVGYNRNGTIRSCYADCAVSGATRVGGLLGRNHYLSTVSFCYASGWIEKLYTPDCGGLVGENLGIIIASFWDTDSSGISTSSGSPFEMGLHTVEMNSVRIFRNAGWGGKGWVMEDGVDYPRLAWENTGGIPIPDPEPTPLSGGGSETDPYQIWTAEDFVLLSERANLLDKQFRLMADLDMTGIAVQPIGHLGEFEGGFDGNSHVIRNVVIDEPELFFVGLFRYLKPTARIVDLHLENTTVTGRYCVGGLSGWNQGIINRCSLSGTVDGTWVYDTNVGGFVGWNEHGNINKCRFAGIVEAAGSVAGGLCGLNEQGRINECQTTGSVNARWYIGGLCGLNQQGRINRSVSSSEITGNFDCKYFGGICGKNEEGWVSECCAKCNIMGGYRSEYIGGLIGFSLQGKINNSFSTTRITVNSWSEYIGGLCGGNIGEIQYCYAAGKVNGGNGSDIGGLCGGYGFNGTVLDSFWDIDNIGQTNNTVGEGKTTAEMKRMSSFTAAGWDFVGETTNGSEDMWRMCADGVEYPRLSWEFSRSGDFACPDGVDVEDLMLLAENWLTRDPNAISKGDATEDNKVGIEDLAILSIEWLKGIPEISRSRVTHWSMDDNAADKVVIDSGGGNHPGTAQRNTAELTMAGRIGGALAFDGTGDWINCGIDSVLLPDAWTVCAWVQCTDTATPTLISFGGTYPAVKLQQNGKGKPLIYLGQYNHRYFDAAAWTTLKDGQWHHVAFVVPGGSQGDIANAAMYLDGQPVAVGTTTSSGPQAAKTRLLIGINSTAGQQRFAGAMDEVMLFNRALTATEIRRIVGQ